MTTPENQHQESDDEESSGSLEQDPSGEEVVQKREMPNRTTRGKRMHELIGKAREEDDQFWKQVGLFQEAESDDDYVASSAGEDVVDSDFDHPEEEEANKDQDESESTKERARKKKGPGYPIARPPKPIHKSAPKADSQQIEAASSQTPAPPGTVPEASVELVEGEAKIQPPAKKTKRLTAEVSLPMEQRSVAVREKTLERTKEAQRKFAEWEKKQIEKEQKKQGEPKQEAPAKMTQIEQLEEAARTEQANIESLRVLQQIELTRQKHTFNKREAPAGTYIRSSQHVDNGALKTSLKVPGPEFLYTGHRGQDSSKRLINKKSLTCAISGKKAKYLDPMTKITYATKEAFKILREKFYQSEEEKMGQRIQALNELLSLKKDKHKRHKALKPEDGDVGNVQVPVRPIIKRRPEIRPVSIPVPVPVPVQAEAKIETNTERVVEPVVAVAMSSAPLPVQKQSA